MDWTQISIKDLVASIQTKMISKFPCRYWKTSWQLFAIQKMMFFTSESNTVVNRVIGWAGGWRLSSLLSQAWRIEMALTKPSHFTSWKCVYVKIWHTYIYFYLLNVFNSCIWICLYIYIEHDHDIFVKGPLLKYIYIYIIHVLDVYLQLVLHTFLHIIGIYKPHKRMCTLCRRMWFLEGCSVSFCFC